MQKNVSHGTLNLEPSPTVQRVGQKLKYTIMAETRNNFKIQFIGLNWDKRRELLNEIENTDLEIGRYYEHFSESDKGDFIYGDPVWFLIAEARWENHYEDLEYLSEKYHCMVVLYHQTEDGYSYKTVYDNGRSILNDSDYKYNNGGW